MPASDHEPKANQPPASKEEARRKIRRITYWSLPFMIIFGGLNLIPDVPLPWQIAVLAVEMVFVIVYGSAAIRFSRWLRDEYWREKGRDPRHPERFPKDR